MQGGQFGAGTWATGIDKSMVSRVCQELDEEVTPFRKRSWSWCTRVCGWTPCTSKCDRTTG